LSVEWSDPAFFGPALSEVGVSVLTKKLIVPAGSAGAKKRTRYHSPVLEGLEPRTLYSADLPGLAGFDAFADPSAELSPTSLPINSSADPVSSSAYGDRVHESQRGLIETEITLSEMAQQVWSDDPAADSTPAFNLLGGDSPTFYNYGAAVALDGDVTVSVVDESATARYVSASITLQRSGGVVAEDDFNVTGNFQPLTEGGALTHDSAGVIGTVTEKSNGKLIIQFNANASTALVNESLQSLTYQTSSFGFVEENRAVDWTFSIETTDGSGQLLFADGQSIVTVSPLSAIAHDDNLGELLASTTLDLTHSDLVANDTNFSANPVTIVNTTDPLIGSLSAVDSGTLRYTTDIGATGLDHFDYTITDGNPDIAYHWRMQDDASDETGRNDAVLSGTPTAGQEGLGFDGDDTLVIPDFDYPDNFTLSFDFKINSLTGTGSEYFYQQGIWSEPNSIHIYARDHTDLVYGHLVTYIKDNEDYDFLHVGYRTDLSALENDGLWHNYTLTRETGVGVSIYIDGQKLDTGTVIRGENGFYPQGDIQVGSYDNADYLDDHQMRDLRLYSAVLDEDEIVANESNRYSTGTVSVELRNEERVDINNGISIFENASSPITAAELKTTDADLTDAPEDLTYTIDSDAVPINGRLQVNLAMLGAGSSFTQKDINDGAVSYTHNGGENTSDSFGFRVDDGRGTHTTGTFNVDIEPVNDAPVAVENSGLSITEGDPATTITASMLAFVDADDDPANLIYNVISPPLAGELVIGTGPLSAITSFSQADINDGLLQYRYDGPDVSSDEFGFELTDGGEDGVVAITDVFKISVASVNDAPIFGNLDNTPEYIKTNGPVILDADLTIADAELDGLFSDNYNGTTLTLQRTGSAAVGDQFSASGMLSPLNEGDAIVYGGKNVGAVTKNSAGSLQLSFANGADNALVTNVMRSIAYSHPSGSLPATVDIEWTFSDGNTTDSQGPGGELLAVGHTVVTIQPIPEYSITAPANINGVEDTTFVFTGVNTIHIDDGILQDQRLQLELRTTAGGVLDFGDSTGLTVLHGAFDTEFVTVEGLESEINAALQALEFTPIANSSTTDSVALKLIPEVGLVARYQFNGNADDSSVGAANQGQVNGSPAYIDDPVRGAVVAIDRPGEHIDVSGIFNEPRSITLSAWVNMEETDKGSEIISLGDNVVLTADDKDTNGVLGTFHTVDEFGNSSWQKTATGIDIEGSGWRHLVYLIDENTSTQRIYIDGNLIAETHHSGSIDYGNQPDTVIGSTSPETDRYRFTGS